MEIKPGLWVVPQAVTAELLSSGRNLILAWDFLRFALSNSLPSPRKLSLFVTLLAMPLKSFFGN
jgi:hypothetical protein